MEISNHRQHLKSRRTTGHQDVVTNKSTLKRQRLFNSSVSIAAMAMSMLLSGSSICHSFTIIPNTAISSMQKSRLSTIPIYNAKESDDVQEEKSFEWDGEVVEGAHDDEFDTIDKSDSDNFTMPSFSLMSMANSVTSPAMSAAAADFDPMKNAGKIHQIAMKEAAMTEDSLLEMGGDPAFLDDVEEDGGGMQELDDADFFGWDGTVNEDAHLD